MSIVKVIRIHPLWTMNVCTGFMVFHTTFDIFLSSACPKSGGQTKLLFHSQSTTASRDKYDSSNVITNTATQQLKKTTGFLEWFLIQNKQNIRKNRCSIFLVFFLCAYMILKILVYTGVVGNILQLTLILSISPHFHTLNHFTFLPSRVKHDIHEQGGYRGQCVWVQAGHTEHVAGTR